MVGEPLRIGVVAGDVLPRWQDDALAELRAAGATIAARFAPGRDQRPFALPRTAERLARGHASALAPVRWKTPALADPSSAAGCDVVLLFAGSDDVPLLDAARFGCWEIVLPGEPPGLDALETGRAWAEVRVERRTPGAPTVVTSSAARVDATSYGRTLRNVLALASALPSDALRRSRAGVASSDAAPSRPSPVRLDARRAARIARRTVVRAAANAIGRRFVHARWRVGRLHDAPASLLTGRRPAVAWLDLPRGAFCADPFPLVAGGRTEVIFERYDYARDRGYLARATLEGDRIAGPVRELARGSHHLSYPFVVADGAARYVLPEQAESGRLVLYALDGERLHDVRVLLEDFPAIDPTLVEHDGRWWLFAGDARREPDAALMLFHAASLEGPWHPHPLNPIVRDVRSARSGGTPFTVDGVLYRPAQDCSTSYGARVAIARIDVLNSDAYRETVVAHVEPPAYGRGRHGLHTVALRDGVCLVDGKDLVLDPAATWAMLRADLRRVFGPAPLARTSPIAEVAHGS